MPPSEAPALSRPRPASLARENLTPTQPAPPQRRNRACRRRSHSFSCPCATTSTARCSPAGPIRSLHRSERNSRRRSARSVTSSGVRPRSSTRREGVVGLGGVPIQEQKSGAHWRPTSMTSTTSTIASVYPAGACRTIARAMPRSCRSPAPGERFATLAIARTTGPASASGRISSAGGPPAPLGADTGAPRSASPRGGVLRLERPSSQPSPLSRLGHRAARD